MRGLPQKQNARRADKIRLCGHLGRYKKIVKKTYIIYPYLLYNFLYFFTITILNIKHLKSGGDKTLPLTNTAYYNSFGLICLILTFWIPYDCINF